MEISPIPQMPLFPAQVLFVFHLKAPGLIHVSQVLCGPCRVARGMHTHAHLSPDGGDGGAAELLLVGWM